jgi:hypothetical protein
MLPRTFLLTGLLMTSIAHATDVPYAAYVGRIGDAERQLSEYNSESISQAFLDRQEVPVSTATPPVYTLKPGQSLALLYHFSKRDNYDLPQPQHLDFLNCARKIRKVDGQAVQFQDMEGFTYSNDHLTSKDGDLRLRGLLHKFEPLLPADQAARTHAIWKFNAQDIAAFAADAAFSDDANQVAGKVLEYMCFHAERDPVPFIVLRLDATAVGKGETWEEKNARLKSERDAAAAVRSDSAMRQRQADRQGRDAPAAPVDPRADAAAARAQRTDSATARRDAANAQALSASEARNAAARERKAALEAARAARREERD